MNNTVDSIYFSIVIPTYNRAVMIKTTIEAVLGQEYSNFEIIVVDDGSTDNTEAVVNSISDSRIRYYKKENEERGAARNYGANLAKGEYINFVDSDDITYPNHLKEAYNFILRNDKPALFHLGYEIITSENKVIKRMDNLKGDITTQLIKENFLSPIGAFVRRDIALQFPFATDRTLAITEDWELWLRLASRFPILYSNTITSKIIDDEQRSIKDYNVDKIIARDMLLIEKLTNDEAFVKKYRKNISGFIADRYTFFTLLLALKKEKRRTIKFLLKAFYTDPSVLIRKRFLVSIKYLIS